MGKSRAFGNWDELKTKSFAREATDKEAKEMDEFWEKEEKKMRKNK